MESGVLNTCLGTGHWRSYCFQSFWWGWRLWRNSWRYSLRNQRHNRRQNSRVRLEKHLRCADWA